MTAKIHLYTGKVFDLLNPRVEDIDIESIAHGLSQIVRWTGQCKEPLTVAQHCCLCCDMAEDEIKLATLLHDASESCVGDLNFPIKSILPEYKEVENRVDKVLCEKFDLPYPHSPIIKEIDLRMLATEAKQLMTGDFYKEIGYEPYNIKIKVWNHKRAKKEFLSRFNGLYRARRETALDELTAETERLSLYEK